MKFTSRWVSLNTSHGGSNSPSETSLQAADKALGCNLFWRMGRHTAREAPFQFCRRQVDEGTARFALLRYFANPDNILRPRGYAKVRAVIRLQRGAVLIPNGTLSQCKEATKLPSLAATARWSFGQFGLVKPWRGPDCDRKG